jgi:hypothetical protein
LASAVRSENALPVDVTRVGHGKAIGVYKALSTGERTSDLDRSDLLYAKRNAARLRDYHE